MSHELLHAYQFINLELDLTINGKGGMFHDKTDEIAAFERQNLFCAPNQTPVNPYELVNTDNNYKNLPSGPLSFHLFSPMQQAQYKGFNNINGLKYIYTGWQKDYKK